MFLNKCGFSLRVIWIVKGYKKSTSVNLQYLHLLDASNIWAKINTWLYGRALSPVCLLYNIGKTSHGALVLWSCRLQEAYACHLLILIAILADYMQLLTLQGLQSHYFDFKCPVMTFQQVKLESCSNPPKKQKVSQAQYKKSGNFCFELFWGWCHEWVGVKGFLDNTIRAWGKITRDNFFVFSFDIN